MFLSLELRISLFYWLLQLLDLRQCVVEPGGQKSYLEIPLAKHYPEICGHPVVNSHGFPSMDVLGHVLLGIGGIILAIPGLIFLAWIVLNTISYARRKR